LECREKDEFYGWPAKNSSRKGVSDDDNTYFNIEEEISDCEKKGKLLKEALVVTTDSKKYYSCRK